MKNYYIVNFNEQNNSIHTAEYLGEYEDLGDARKAAFSKMGEDDMLVGFEPDIEPEYTTTFGLETVNLELADDEEKAFLRRTDGSEENIPEGLWFWDNGNELYTSDGEEWGGFLIQNNDSYVSIYVNYNKTLIDLSELSFADIIKKSPGDNVEAIIDRRIKLDIETIEDVTEISDEEREKCMKELGNIYQGIWDRECEDVIKRYKDDTELLFNPINKLSPEKIEDIVFEHVLSIVEENNVDAFIKGIAIFGSRSRGLEHEGSDLDIVIGYSGDIREDDFFNLLHGNEFKIEGITVDINPIINNRIGDIAEYLLKAEAYLKGLAEEAAAKEPVEKSVSNNLQQPGIKFRLLPDKLQPADMQEYGYKWDGILPLTKERAAELFGGDVTVYKLHPDNTETAVEDKILDIEQYDGMFGVEKRDWLIYLRDKIDRMSEAEKEGLINGVEAGFATGYDVAAEDIAIYHCLTSNVRLPEKLAEHSTGVEPVDKKGFGYEQPFRVIEKAHYNGQDLFLLESEAPESLDGNVITDENGNIIMENVRNGFTEYVENREYLVDRYDLRHPISFKSDSGVDIELKQYFKMPYNLKFVFNDVCKIYIGKVGNLEDRIILKNSDNYIYSAEFNKDYDDGKIHLTNNLDIDEYKFEVLGNSERINNQNAEKNLDLKDDLIASISNYEFDEDGYLHFTIEADGYELEGLFRVNDEAEPKHNMKLVSIDYGYLHPIIKEYWNEIEQELILYAKEKLVHKSNALHEVAHPAPLDSSVQPVVTQPEPEYIISPRERQQQEIATIKERNVVLNLSDADCDRLARKAGEAGISIGELLEGFIGDLVGGTYSHGSDEEYLAKQWFDRCGFREFQEETLLNNLIVMGYDVDTFLDVCDNIKQCEADIIKSKEHPEEYDPEEITYLEDDLEYYRDEFNDYTEDFRSGHKAADMDKEIEICRKWRDDFASLKVPELQPKPEKITVEKKYSTKDIEQLISNRKQTHYGFYADISDAVRDVPTDKLTEYYKEKLGESRLRDFLETEISKAEILKEKNKNFCKSNSKTHEEYER